MTQNLASMGPQGEAGCYQCCSPTATHHGPTMWAGTNSGSVFAYALEVPSQEKFSERAVEAVLGKEIQLMHRAPVVSIAVLDGRGNPLPEPYEVSRDLAKAPDMQGSHSVLISSEEQFKVRCLLVSQVQAVPSCCLCLLGLSQACQEARGRGPCEGESLSGQGLQSCRVLLRGSGVCSPVQEGAGGDLGMSVSAWSHLVCRALGQSPSALSHKGGWWPGQAWGSCGSLL